ncbi:putative clathrin assembly protein At5g57200 isoform X2 [Wolffia australiana]
MKAWRKVYHAIKDSALIGRAKIVSEFKDIDVAIVKATRHAESLPKERCIRKILAATSSVRPPSDVAYCVHKLARRLAKTHSWTVALKILIIIHRSLRNGDQTFREELMNYAHRRHIFHSFNFTDNSSPLARECSSWVSAYALFLEERLECLSTLKFDVETESLINSSSGSAKAHSRMRLMPCDELLTKLPSLQQLLFRLTGCQSEISAYRNQLIQYALALLVKESYKIYCAISDGIINLVDLFFGMSRNDAMRALCIYKKAGLQVESLSKFYELAKNLELCRNFQFPQLKQPPPSFLKIMDEYIGEAPPAGSVSESKLGHEDKSKSLSQKLENSAANNGLDTAANTRARMLPLEEGTLGGEGDRATKLPVPDLRDLKPLPTQMKTRVIVHSSAFAHPEEDKKPNPVAGWELALFSASSPVSGNLTGTKLGGSFDWHLLDDLYGGVNGVAAPTSNPLFVSLPAKTTPSLL